jgi:hypothetical protein
MSKFVVVGRIQSMQEQVASASPDRKSRIEPRIAETSAEGDRRAALLEQAIAAAGAAESG